MDKFEVDPVIRKWCSVGPRTFAKIVLPLIERYGDEVKELISKVRFKEGSEKGQRLREKVQTTDDLVEFERTLIHDFVSQGFNAPDFDDPARDWTIQTKNRCGYTTRLCGGCELGIPGVWKNMGIDEETIKMLGEIYCVPYDTAVRTTFNPKMKFKFVKLAPRGDPYCEWLEELDE